MELDWSVDREGDASLVGVRVRNDGAVPRRVRIESRLDGPVLPPRRGGVPESGWGAEGVTAVIDPGERAAFGFAALGDRADPPVEITSVESMPPDAENSRASTESDSDRVRAAVRNLESHHPPRRTVDRKEAVDRGDKRRLGGAKAVGSDGDAIDRTWDATDDDGAVVAGFSQFQDTTEQKRREQELHEEQAFIDRSLDALGDIFYFVDTDGDFQRWNSTLPELTGYSDEEIGSMNALEFFEGEHREAISHSIREILAHGAHVTEAEITTADGRQVPHEFRGVRMTDDDGAPTGIIGIARDITDRIERERQLEQKTEELEQLATKYELQYRTLFEEAPVMTVLTRSENGQPVVEDCNSQFVETLGYDADAITGSELAEFYTPESAERLLSGAYTRSVDGEFTKEKRELVTPDGEVVEALLRAVPRRTADGDIVGTVAMYIDITERESVKRANERLEEFTSVVSHDLRNPLNVATGRLELAAEECDSDHLDQLEHALDRMEALIDDLLTLAREGREVTDAGPVDLASMIEGCWENVETDEAVLHTTIDRRVRADRSRLKQVFENLFRNSVEHGSTSNRRESGDSVEHGSTGSRTESDDSVEHAGADVRVTVGELDDGFYIEDDGPGIPADEREEVFEAGYSRSADGTGFGLSIIQRVVDAHGWQIRVTDGSDGGARFEITGVEFVSA